MFALVAPPVSRTFVARTKYKLYGIVFLVICALFLALTVAVYNKAFKTTVPVTLKADRAGLQLLPDADVKVRGLIVGDVSKITTNGEVATISLALDPSKVGLIPANIKARLLPKTLFGQKYVDLVVPKHPVAQHIEAGDVIPQDRSETAIELGKVFDNVLPLLRTLNPRQLNETLHAMVVALRGRGDEIGANLVGLDRYLRTVNPHLPTLKRDISLLADFAETYQQAAPDLLRVLRNLTFSSHTVVDERQTLDAFLGDVTRLADTGRGVLAENADQLIRVNSVYRPSLRLLADYSPEYPCLTAGLAELEPRLEKAFGGNQPALHITLELEKPRAPYHYPADLPQWNDHRGPRCYGLPNPSVPFPAPQNRQPRDGTEDDAWAQGLRQYGAAHGASQGAAQGASLGRPLSDALVSPSMGYAGTKGEQRLINHIVGPAMGTPPDRVPDVADLLFGPMARGTVVNVR